MLSTTLPEMLHTEQLSTLQEENIIPEAASQGMTSGDNIYSSGTFVSVQMAVAIDGKKYIGTVSNCTPTWDITHPVYYTRILLSFRCLLEMTGFRLQGSFGFILLNQMQWWNYIKFMYSFRCGQVILTTAISQAWILSSLFREHN